ncbi:MAG: thermonuclease family protein [Clostridiales bacterium]|jgi:micrococcal nuclease|nr:thermonuclease family protein [Eubacteriales bacterium]MDH7566905.1 thermonuclease family protein [Clostridiales bacterium]
MKKVLIPVLAAAVIVGGYFFNASGINNKFTGIKNVDEIPPQILEINKEGLSPNHFVDAVVVKVLDGDTFEVRYKLALYKVRMLDLDTPESVKPNVPVQPFAKEASEFTRKKLLNQPVKLYFEKDLKDRYDRLLAYVFLKDGSFFNALLVRNGFARVEIVKPNIKYKEYFYKLQEQAIEEKAGLWGLKKDMQPFVKNESGEYVPKYLLQGKAS